MCRTRHWVPNSPCSNYGSSSPVENLQFLCPKNCKSTHKLCKCWDNFSVKTTKRAAVSVKFHDIVTVTTLPIEKSTKNTCQTGKIVKITFLNIQSGNLGSHLFSRKPTSFNVPHPWNTKKKSARSDSFSRLRFIQRVLDLLPPFFFCCGGPSRSAKVASKSACAAATLPAYWESRASHSSAAAAYTAAFRAKLHSRWEYATAWAHIDLNWEENLSFFSLCGHKKD